jgi:hypothetical protein
MDHLSSIGTYVHRAIRDYLNVVHKDVLGEVEEEEEEEEEEDNDDHTEGYHIVNNEKQANENAIQTEEIVTNTDQPTPTPPVPVPVPRSTTVNNNEGEFIYISICDYNHRFTVSYTFSRNGWFKAYASIQIYPKGF